MINKISAVLFMALLICTVFQVAAQSGNDKGYNMSTITPKGNQAPEEISPAPRG